MINNFLFKMLGFLSPTQTQEIVKKASQQRIEEIKETPKLPEPPTLPKTKVDSYIPNRMTKNSIFDLYRPFLDHVSSCDTCNTIEDTLCIRGSELHSSSKVSILKFVSEPPEKKAEIEIKEVSELQKQAERTYKGVHKYLKKAKRKLEGFRACLDLNSSNFADFAEVVTSLEETIFLVQAAFDTFGMDESDDKESRIITVCEGA